MSQQTMLAEPPPTRFDIHFRVFGFPVRVSPFFWLTGLLLGLYSVESMENASAGDKLGVFLLFVAAIFISILVHELGHAFLIRRYGWGSRIILYHFGGLATFESAEKYVPIYNENESKAGVKIRIAIAGPAAGFVLAGIVIAILLVSGTGFTFHFDVANLIFWGIPGLADNLRLYYFVQILLFINIFWGLMNLLPVYPLDGGQIARELLTLKNPRKGIERSLIVSAVTGAVVAAAALIWKQIDGIFVALMFGILGFSSYRTLVHYKAQLGGGFGGPDDYDDADWWKK